MSELSSKIVKGINAKTINGKHGQFIVLKIDIERLCNFLRERSDDGTVMVALYPRQEPDEFHNTHTPKLFFDNKLSR